jgi:DNA-binding transcriptional LysR family regulator
LPADLGAHNCIRQRFASGAIHQWALAKRGKSVEVLVNGSFIVSDGDLALRAALDGVGLARLPITSVEAHIARRELVPLLEDWTPPSVGFFLYYPSRRQTPAPLQAFVDFLKTNSSAPESRRSGTEALQSVSSRSRRIGARARQ